MLIFLTASVVLLWLLGAAMAVVSEDYCEVCPLGPRLSIALWPAGIVLVAAMVAIAAMTDPPRPFDHDLPPGRSDLD